MHASRRPGYEMSVSSSPSQNLAPIRSEQFDPENNASAKRCIDLFPSACVTAITSVGDFLPWNNAALLK
jgi:hypothetical protein